MSRFGGNEGKSGDFNRFYGWLGKALSGRRTNASLHEFLAHLDAMPTKRILVEKLYEPSTGDACTIGEFAKMRGVSQSDLAESARRVQIELDNEDDQGLDSATVWVGRDLGMPASLAWDLGAYNDTLDKPETVVAEGPPTTFKDYPPLHVDKKIWKYTEAEGPPCRYYRERIAVERFQSQFSSRELLEAQAAVRTRRKAVA